MASNEAVIPAALPPWRLKGTIYTFMNYVSKKDTQVLSSDKSFLYSPLEASSSFAKDKFIGGLAMVQVIRYVESPVGPYDEFLVTPGAFEYDVEMEQNGRNQLVKKKNTRVTRIYVSQKQTCWNGRISESQDKFNALQAYLVTDWNIPKHLARFAFTDLPDNAVAIAVYPNDVGGSPSESVPSQVPVFSAIYKPIPYLPSFPISTSVAKYVGLDISLVQPPLPEGNGSAGELPGTQRWCQCLPLEYSQKTSLGWWDLKQGKANELDSLLRGENDSRSGGEVVHENFWPGFGRWRIGMKMEDATIEFPHGRYWDEPRL